MKKSPLLVIIYSTFFVVCSYSTITNQTITRTVQTQSFEERTVAQNQWYDPLAESFEVVDDNGVFALKDPHKNNYLYFPLVSERGMVSVVTPMLHGDIKSGQNTFLTPNLMIELKRTLFIPPKENKIIYLRFPVEIGVIVKNGKNEKLVDVFAKNPPKYTLYGDVRTGTICRYYLSNLSLKVPKTDIGSEGVIEVSIRNQTNEWREISKLVFLGTLMKIYYSEDLVSMKALVKVTDDDMAETKFIDQPIRDGQKRAFETLPTKNKKMAPQRFVMEGGY